MTAPSVPHSWLHRTLPPLFLLLSLVLFFAPGLFSGRVYFFRDLGMEILPKRQFFSEAHGFALWNPYVFAGEPFAANPQSSAFHPLSLLWRFGPVELLLGPYLALHFLLAAILAYLLFLELGLSRASALAGAFAFIFSGAFASLGLQVVNLNSAIWIPGIFWLALRLQRTASGFTAGALGILIALQILGGEPEIVYLTLLALAAYLVLGRARSHDLHRNPLSRWPALAGAVILGLGLSAAQWLLTLEMLPHSNRAANLSLADVSAYSLEFRDLVSLAVPHLVLDPDSPLWGYGFWSRRLPYLLSIYPGIIVLLLAPFSFSSPRRREALFWLVLALLALGLSLGPAGRLYSLAMEWLPGFGRFRFPERILILLPLAAAWMAGLGLETISANPPKTSSRLLPALLLIAAAALPALYFLPALEQLPPMAFLFSRSALRSLLLADLFAVLALFAGADRLRSGFAAALILLLLWDLFSAHFSLNPTVPRSFYTTPIPAAGEFSTPALPPRRVWIAPPPSRLDRSLGRDENPRAFYREQRDWLQPFFALAARIADLNAKSSFYLAQQDELNSLLWPADAPLRGRLLGLSGVEKIFVPREGWRTVPETLPRAYLAFAPRFVAAHEQALAALSAPDFDPKREVVIEEKTSTRTVLPPLRAPIKPASVLDYQNETVAISAEADQPAWLVLLDSYYPGWQARVDDKPQRIRRANGFFRAVPIPPGRHLVQFDYRPVAWDIARGLSLGMLCSMGLALMLWRGARWGIHP